MGFYQLQLLPEDHVSALSPVHKGPVIGLPSCLRCPRPLPSHVQLLQMPARPGSLTPPRLYARCSPCLELSSPSHSHAPFLPILPRTPAFLPRQVGVFPESHRARQALRGSLLSSVHSVLKPPHTGLIMFPPLVHSQAHSGCLVNASWLGEGGAAQGDGLHSVAKFLLTGGGLGWGGCLCVALYDTQISLLQRARLPKMYLLFQSKPRSGQKYCQLLPYCLLRDCGPICVQTGWSHMHDMYDRQEGLC